MLMDGWSGCVCGKKEADRIAGSVAEEGSLRVTHREQP